ncbi:MAG: hypothetical protein NWQ17_09175 [Polaribacter sp.]|nr:hypothetical protein [Polaribacter sp.]
MIKLFRKIRQNLLNEGKTSKYIKYAIGEIILVVIGILIALQLNTHKENKEKSDLGYQYLKEMKYEVQKDFFMIDGHIKRLQFSLKNQEAALKTKNIASLPLDSINMILSPENLDFKISELTFNKMNNLGLTALSANEKLNTQISDYYNAEVVSLKLAMAYVFEELKKYLDFFQFQQNDIDLSDRFSNTTEFEFPALYNQSKEEFNKENTRHKVDFIMSTQGRNLVLNDLSNKKYSLRRLVRFKKQTQQLLEAIYEELKSKNPDLEPLPEFPTEEEYKEIKLSKEIMLNYVGTYKSEENDVVEIRYDQNNQQLTFQYNSNGALELLPLEENRFFIKNYYTDVYFKKEADKIIGFSSTRNGEIDFKKN